MAKPKITQKLYNLEEDEIQSLIQKAKENDPEAQRRLLEVFDNFLSKYVALLFYAKLDLDNVNIRKFLALYVTDKVVGYHLMGNRLNPVGYKRVNETLNGIQYMVQRYCAEEDVRNTIHLSFLECIRKYKRTPSKQGGWVPFSGFLNNYYHYILKRNVDMFLIDQNGRNTFPLIYETDDEGDEQAQQGFSLPPVPSVEELLGPEEIDEYWVVGDTAMPPFDCLSIQDRQLLKWRYADGMKSSQIALKITEHSNTVREHYNKIRRKLQVHMLEDLDSDYLN